jgi:hypothetical protein
MLRNRPIFAMELRWPVVVLAALMTSACSATIPYQPQTNLGFADSSDIVEEIVLTQHEAWRPDQVNVTDKFITFDHGSVTDTRGKLLPLTARSSTRSNSGRAYYKRITGITLSSWIRNFRTWYVVRLEGKLAIRDQSILRTRDLGQAKQLCDALASLVAQSRSQAVSVEIPNDEEQ